MVERVSKSPEGGSREKENKKIYDACREAVERDPNDWEAWEEGGNFFLQRGDLPRAYACFTHAIESLKFSKKEISPDDYFNLYLNWVKVLIDLPKGNPRINLLKGKHYLENFEKKITDPQKQKEINDIKKDIEDRLSKEGVEVDEDLYKMRVATLEELEKKVKVKDPKERVLAWYTRGKWFLDFQEGTPKEWLGKSKESFEEAWRILDREITSELTPEEKREIEAMILYHMGVIEKDMSDFDPFAHPQYGDRKKRIRDLENAAGYFQLAAGLSHPKVRELIEGKPVEKPDKIFFKAQDALEEVNKELKKLKGEISSK